MDPGKSEHYEFLDLSDIEENERRRIKHVLYSDGTPHFLQLPWINNTTPEEWHSDSYGDEGAHLPNGPPENQHNQDAAMAAPERGAAPIAQHVPIVTVYQPPGYSIPPPSTGYQHPPGILVSSMSPNVNLHHGYVAAAPAGHYVQQHYNMAEPPSDMGVRGHRGRSRGRGTKRMDNSPMVEGASPGYPPSFFQLQFHPGYYNQPVASPLQHPNAQHATGSPLYITPMYAPMYGQYPHATQYYSPPNAHMMEDASPEPPLPPPQQLPPPPNLQQPVFRPAQPQQPAPVVKEEYIPPPEPVSIPAVHNNNNNIIKVEMSRAVLPRPTVNTIIQTECPAVEPVSNNLDNGSASESDPPPVHPETECKVQPSVDNTNSVCVKPAVPVEVTPGPAPPVNSPDIKPVVDSEPEPIAATAASGKSWASLFVTAGGIGGGGNPIVEPSPEKPQQNDVFKPSRKISYPFAKIEEKRDEKCAQNVPAIDKSIYANDPNSHRIGEFLVKYTLNNRTVSLEPRGLTNRSNYCYINSILQALLACPPFYNLLKALPYQPRKNPMAKSPTPIIDTMYEFVNEFVPVRAGARVNRKEKGQRKDDSMDVACGACFEPSRIYKILNGIRSDTFIVEGRQEDAEEFFGCLLNGLNDEMLELMKLVETGQNHQNLSNGDITTNGDHEDKDEWKEVMGPKHRGSITRRADFDRTPISDIFRGQLRSRLHRVGDQATTDSVQPFFTLQLDIEKASSVSEALETLVSKHNLEGVTCSRTNQQVEAWQQVTLEELPLVMVLHLKCFNYKLDACSKIVKAVEFPIDLKMDAKLLSLKVKNPGKQKYKLFAVVYHEGNEAIKGHYLTDAYHVGYGGWVRYDDQTVRAVSENIVLHPATPRVPYLLFYRRADTIGNQPQQQQHTPPKKD